MGDYLKISGGLFHDCAVHDIDLITWTLGELPHTVYCAATSLIPEIGAIQDVDSAVITLTFPSGTIAQVDLSRISIYGYDQRLEVFGPLGMLDVKNETPNNTVFSGENGSQEDPIYYSFPSRHCDGYRVELSVTAQMTSAVSKIADACEESVKSGLPVKLNWSAEEIPMNYTFSNNAN